MQSLGKYIRQLREEKKHSLRALARQIGKSAPFLSDVELDRRTPSDVVLSDIAKFLDVEMDELRKYNHKATFRDLKKLADDDPVYSIALRMIIDKEISSNDLLKLLKKEKHRCDSL